MPNLGREKFGTSQCLVLRNTIESLAETRRTLCTLQSLSPIAHHRAGLPNITQREAPVGMRPIIITHYPTYASHESRRGCA
jgi:hypothetical protein